MNKLQPTVIPPGAILIAVTAVAVIWGVLAVVAVSPELIVFIHSAVALCAAAAAAFAAAFVDFRYWKRIAPAAGAVMLVLLFVVALAGVEINGMCGWFDLGICMVQPSEIAKPFFALVLSVLFLDQDKRKRQAGMLMAGGFFAAIVMEPDFGTLAIFVAGGFMAAFFAGIALRHLITALLITFAGAVSCILTVRYAVVRVWEYFSLSHLAESPWHWRQMQIAAARGGWAGTGSDGAWWSSGFLPLAHNDSLYSVIAEGAGFGGALLVCLLWCLWAWSVTGLAARNRDIYCKVTIGTIGGMMLVQTFIHIASNTGLLPITGVNLPLMSYGGSSMVACGIMTGIIFSAARNKMAHSV